MSADGEESASARVMPGTDERLEVRDSMVCVMFGIEMAQLVSVRLTSYS